MTLAKKWLFTTVLGAASVFAASAYGQIVVTSADYVPAIAGRVAVTEVAYRPYYGRRAYYGGYYRPNRAYYSDYGPRGNYQYRYGARWGGYYRPYYSNRAFGYPGYGYRANYGYRYARPGFSYGWGWY